MCFGVNRLERPGEKNIIGRCKEKYFAELLGGVNTVGEAALPGQDSGCRATPGSCSHISVVRPRTPAERRPRGAGARLWRPPQPRSSGESPVHPRREPLRKNASGADRCQREYFLAFRFPRDFPHTALPETSALPRAPFECFVDSILLLKKQEIPH